MKKFRFVWRRVCAGNPSLWREKHIFATTPEEALLKMKDHFQKLIGKKPDQIEIDHLFFMIGAGGLNGNDRVEYTISKKHQMPNRLFHEFNFQKLPVTVI